MVSDLSACVLHRLLPLAQGLGVQERLEALQNLSTEGRMTAGEWLWAFFGIGVAVACAAALVATVWRRFVRARRQYEGFQRRIGGLGLSEQERAVVTAIAKAAGKSGFEAVLTAAPAFERGLAALARSSRFASASPDRQAEILALAESVRSKLGLQEAREAPVPVLVEPPIQKGDRLTVAYRGQATVIDLEVLQAAGDEIVVAAAGPARCRAGETLLVRCSRAGGELWEFDAPVVTVRDDRIVLRRQGRLRYVNRRRFPRVPTARPAHVATLPLWRTQAAVSSQDFRPAKLVEIGGPGLRLACDLAARSGDRVLVALELGEGRIIEGVGRVHRVSQGEDGQKILAVELVGLTQDEVAQLIHETNMVLVAAHRQGAPQSAPRPEGQAAPARPAGPVRPAQPARQGT